MTYTYKITKFLLNLVGKNYSPDPDIPFGLLCDEAITRSIMLLRGMIAFRKFLFIGRNVHIRGKGNITVGKMATFGNGVIIDAYSKNGVVIGDRCKIGDYSIIRSTSHLSTLGKGLSIGNNSGTGEYCFFGCAGGIIIGDDVIMGQYVSFHSQEHIFSDTNILIRIQGTTEKGIKIGSNCWVGARVTFLDGAIIGNNSVVAAGSVVRGEFPQDVVIAGVPARIIKARSLGEQSLLISKKTP